VQLDANMGWASAVQELLLYASPRLVKLLPALPAAWKSGSARGLRFCAGSVAMQWDAERGRFEAELCAEREARLAVKRPETFGGCRWRLEHADGETGEGECGDGFEVRLRAGSRLRLWS
jgi:alpha-L-fucosidase 2